MSIIVAGLGATKPPDHEMLSLEEAVQFLSRRFGVHVTDHEVATMRDIGMHRRWLSDRSSDDLLLEAAKEAISRAKALDPDFAADKLGVIMCGGSTPPRAYPAQSARLSKTIGAPTLKTYVRDVPGACSSWTQAVITASDVMQARGFTYGLTGCGEVIGSRSNDPNSGKNFLMWDDNGAATVLKRSNDFGYGIIHTLSGADYHNYAESVGAGSDYIRPITTLSSISESPYTVERPDAHLNNGKALYHYIIDPRNISQLVTNILQELWPNLDMNDRIFFAPHGANLRMVNKLGALIGFPVDKILTLLGERGRSNMSSASIPSTLEHFAAKPGYFRRDDIIVIVSFSAGLLIDVIVYRVSGNDAFTNTA